MRLKQITVNGRRLSASKETVYTVNRTGGNAQPELTFANMDTLLEAMEKNERSRIDMNTMTSGYYPEIRETECGTSADGLVLAFGCWEVGNLEKFKAVYEQLKEINKDPELGPIPGLVPLPSGYYVRLVEGTIYTSDEEGNSLDRVMTLDDAKLALANMEFRKSIVEPPKPRNVIIAGTGDKVTFQYACQTFELDAFKKVLEALTQAGATTKTEPVAG